MELLGALEAEKLTKQKCKQYCRTPVGCCHNVNSKGTVQGKQRLQGKFKNKKYRKKGKVGVCGI